MQRALNRFTAKWKPEPQKKNTVIKFHTFNRIHGLIRKTF